MTIRCFYLRLQTGAKIRLHGGGHILLHVDCIDVGAGRPGPHKPLSYSGWYERRTDEIEEKWQDVIAESLRKLDEEEEAEAAKPENILHEAEKEIALQIMAEQLERQEKEKKRRRAFTALEIGKQGGLQGTFREKLAIKQKAKLEADKRLDQWDEDQKRQDEIKADRLYNLKKADLANAENERREEELREARSANLKKARAAKKRKKNKEIKRQEEIKKKRNANLKKARAAKKRKKK